MKKVIGMILTVIILLSVTFPVFAETQPNSTEAPATEVPTTEVPTTEIPATEPPATEAPAIPSAAVLQLDTVHQFANMNGPFETGYIPNVEDGAAEIFLPLISTAPLQNGEITVSLDLGPAGMDAFVAANYEKSFLLTEMTPVGSDYTVPIYPVAFSLTLSGDRLNDVYPVTAHVRGRDEAGNPVTLDYTVFVTVKDGKSKNPPMPAIPEPEKPTAEPVVYISDSELVPASVKAGAPFTLTVTLKNSLSTKSVKNLLLTLDLGSESIELLEKGNVIPVDSIEAGGEVKVTLRMKAEPTIPEGKHQVNLSFRYDSSTALGLSSSGSYVFTVRQPAKLSFDGAKLPAKVFCGAAAPISIDLMNTGKAPLYNCQIRFAVKGLESGGSVFVGQIAPGESKTGNGSLQVGTDQLGATKGTVTITYEDAYGESYTQTTDVSTQIVPQPEEEEKPDEKEEKSSNGWMFAAAGLVAGGGLGVGIPWLIRDRKQRKQDDLRL